MKISFVPELEYARIGIEISDEKIEISQLSDEGDVDQYLLVLHLDTPILSTEVCGNQTVTHMIEL